MYLNEESLGLIAVMMMMMVSKSCEREENTHKAPEGVGMHAQNQINVVLNVPLFVVFFFIVTHVYRRKQEERRQEPKT